MRKYQVLLIEDEPLIQECYQNVLSKLNCEVLSAPDGKVGQNLLKTKPVDVVVTDWMMPELSGVELTRWIRQTQKSPVPIIMITARANPEDVLEGLDAGVDDYINKPINFKELELRLKNVLLRLEMLETMAKKPAYKTITKNDLFMNLETMEVKVQDRPLTLTRYEFRILKAMLENQGKILSRNQLMSMAQGEEVKKVGRAIDTHVFVLRQKLGDAGSFIESIRGVGYRIKAD